MIPLPEFNENLENLENKKFCKIIIKINKNKSFTVKSHSTFSKEKKKKEKNNI